MKYRRPFDNDIRSKSNLYWKSDYWGMRFYYDAPLPYGTATILANDVTCIIAVSTETVKDMGEYDDEVLSSAILRAGMEPVEAAVKLACAGCEEVDLGPAVKFISELRPKLAKLTKKRIKEDKKRGELRKYREGTAELTPVIPWMSSIVETIESYVLAADPEDFLIRNSKRYNGPILTIPILESEISFLFGEWDRENKILYCYSPRIAEKLRDVVVKSGREVRDVCAWGIPMPGGNIFGRDLFWYLRCERRRAARTLPRRVSSALPEEMKELISNSWGAFDRMDLPVEVLRYLELLEPEIDHQGCCLCSEDSDSLDFCEECMEEVKHGLEIRGNSDWESGVEWGLQQYVNEFGTDVSSWRTPFTLAAITPEEGLRAFRSMLAKQGDIPWSKRTAAITGWHRPSFGTYCTAKDGHFCRSLLERVIDDFMSLNKIYHEPEPSYPLDDELNANGSLRADWQLADGTFVEAFGLLGRTDYARKAENKRKLARKHNVRLVEIRPEDTCRLDEILNDWIPKESASEA